MRKYRVVNQPNRKPRMILRIVSWTLVFLVVVNVFFVVVTGTSPASAASGSWNRFTVQDLDHRNSVNSIALDSQGIPHISYMYYDDLQYTKSVLTASGGWTWEIEAIETNFNMQWGLSGASISIDIHNDIPSIAYYLYYNFNEEGNAYEETEATKYAQATSIDGWNIETVDSRSTGSVSLSVDSEGFPHLSYFSRGDSHSLKYATWTGSAWIVETVETGINYNSYGTSIALDSNGSPHISYDHFGVGLQYAKRSGSTWSIETVDELIYGSGGSSIAIDGNDNPHISYDTWPSLRYMGFTAEEIRYATWNGNTWIKLTVSESSRPFGAPSIALGGDGTPHITFAEILTAPEYHSLMYARLTSSTWTIETVDREGGGSPNDLALDQCGYAHISYLAYDEDSWAQKYANNKPFGTSQTSPRCQAPERELAPPPFWCLRIVLPWEARWPFIAYLFKCYYWVLIIIPGIYFFYSRWRRTIRLN